MSITLVCPACLTRWKITASPDTRDEPAICPSCAPAEVVDLDARRHLREQPATVEASGPFTAPQAGTNPVSSSVTITHSSPPGAWMGPA